MEPTTEIAVVDPVKYKIEKAEASKVGDALFPMITEREILHKEFLSVVELEISPENCETAAVLYRKLVKVGTGIEKIRKTQKDFSLQYGRFVDAYAKAEALPVIQMKEKLKEMVDHFKIIEQKRVEKLLADRLEMSLPLDPEAPRMRLGEMSSEVFESYYDCIVLADRARKDRAAKEESERVAKEKAELEERERIAKENARLTAEAAERDRKEAAERAERQKAEKARLEKEAKEKEAHEAALKKERDAREKVEAEAKAKEAAELKAKEDAAAREKDTANRKRVNNAAMGCIVAAGVSKELAKALVVAIAKGEIENVSISY